MKAYRIELLALDFENYGEEELKMLAMNARGLDPTVISIEGRDIGEWDDDHLLNKRSTAEAEFRRLFAAPSSPVADDGREALIAARAWIVKNRPALTLSRQSTIDEYLALLEQIDCATFGGKA